MKEVMNPTKTSQESVITDPELTKELAQEAINGEVKEVIDVEVKNEEVQEKSLNDIKAEMEIYRANIKKGETKNERGQYDEALILENETKLREAEKEIKRIEMEEKKAQKISELQNEIADYRQLITTAEKRNDEKGVLENEDKLRAVEKKILNIKEHGLEAGLSESVDAEEEIAKIREELKTKEVSTEKVSEATQEPKTEETPKKVSTPLWKKMSNFWMSDKVKNSWWSKKINK